MKVVLARAALVVAPVRAALRPLEVVLVRFVRLLLLLDSPRLVELNAVEDPKVPQNRTKCCASSNVAPVRQVESDLAAEKSESAQGSVGTMQCIEDGPPNRVVPIRMPQHRVWRPLAHDSVDSKDLPPQTLTVTVLPST